MRIEIVTRVPADRTDEGNLSFCIPLIKIGESYQESLAVFGGMAMAFRQPLFKVGEILYIDDEGRDQFDRKPGKWDISTTVISNPKEIKTLLDDIKKVFRLLDHFHDPDKKDKEQ